MKSQSMLSAKTMRMPLSLLENELKDNTHLRRAIRSAVTAGACAAAAGNTGIGARWLAGAVGPVSGAFEVPEQPVDGIGGAGADGAIGDHVIPGELAEIGGTEGGGDAEGE